MPNDVRLIDWNGTKKAVIDWVIEGREKAPEINGLQALDGFIGNHSKHGQVVTFDVRKQPAELAAFILSHKETLFSIPVSTSPSLSALVEQAKALEAAHADAVKAEAATLEPAGYTYEAGCDSGDRHRVLWPIGSSTEAQTIAERSLDALLEAIHRHVMDADLRAIAEATGAESIAANLATYGGWSYGPEGWRRIAAIAQAKLDELAAKAEAKLAAKAGKHAAALAEAAATGKNVEIERWTDECDDPREECSMDVITRYATPTGTVKTVRRHTH